MRSLWVIVHRWCGLVMTIFLVLTGLTGSLLAWNTELDRLAWPVLRQVKPPFPTAQPLDPITLYERIRQKVPYINGDDLPLSGGTETGYPVRFTLKPHTNSNEGAQDDELYVNPYTGQELGRRKTGDLTQGTKNLMPFIFKLHYSLALDGIGSLILGSIALIWSLDCFIGAYLTFPRGRPFLEKWKPSWKIQKKRLNYDLHRAGSLWLWAMLFVFAWSSVGFNLRQVYTPVMKALFPFNDAWADIPNLTQPQPVPHLSLQQALATGRNLAAKESARLDFQLLDEFGLYYLPAKAVFAYCITSSRDIRTHGGNTVIFFNANTGQLVNSMLPSGQASGNTITNWLYALHMASVGGVPYQVLVSLMGLAVPVLSVTGVIIWWRKRKSRSGQLSKMARTQQPAKNYQADPLILVKPRTSHKVEN